MSIGPLAIRLGKTGTPHADCSGMSSAFDEWVFMTEALGHELQLARGDGPQADVFKELRRLSHRLLTMNDDQRSLARQAE